MYDDAMTCIDNTEAECRFTAEWISIKSVVRGITKQCNESQCDTNAINYCIDRYTNETKDASYQQICRCTPYNRIEHSARIRHTRKRGYLELRLLYMKRRFNIHSIIWRYLQLFDDIFNYLTISSIIWRYLQLFDDIFNYLTISSIIWRYLQLFDDIFNYLTISSFFKN